MKDVIIALAIAFILFIYGYGMSSVGHDKAHHSGMDNAQHEIDVANPNLKRH